MKTLIKPTLVGLGLLLASGLYADVELHDHDGHHHRGGGVDLVIIAADRFDPLVQQLLMKKQLANLPVIDTPKYVVIPHHGDAELTEAQIRYLEQLLAEVEQ